MTPESFWESTMDEISVYIECIRDKERCKFNDLHYLASLIRLAVNTSEKIPTWEELVNNKNGINAEASNVYNGWEDSKAYMMAIQAHRR